MPLEDAGDSRWRGEFARLLGLADPREDAAIAFEWADEALCRTLAEWQAMQPHPGMQQAFPTRHG